MERLPLAAAGSGSGPWDKRQSSGSISFRNSTLSATLVGGVPFPQHETALSALFCCSSQCSSQWHFGYIITLWALKALLSLPAISCPLPSCLALVSRPCVSLRCENRPVPRPEVETGKQTKLNKTPKPGILCVCSSICCYPESLKSLLDSRRWASLLIMGVIRVIFCCCTQHWRTGIKRKRTTCFPTLTIFITSVFLLMVNVFFSTLGHSLEGGDCWVPEEGKELFLTTAVW